MPKLKAVLFDLDGTLRDTRELIYTSFDYTFTQHGLRSPSRQELAPYIHHHTFVHKQFASDISLEEFEQTYGAKIDELLPSVQLYSGVLELLADLHSKGYKLAVVTAAKSAPQDVKDYGIDRYLDALVSANDVTRHKPDPEGVNVALKRLGIAAHEAVLVGDLATDLRAAEAAHLAYKVAITHGFGNQESLEKAGADYLIDSLAELPAVLERFVQ